MLRRAFRQTFSAAVAGAIAITGLLAVSSPAVAEITAEEIPGDITIFSGAGGNIIVHESPQGLLLVDGGSAAHAPELIDVIDDRYDGKPIDMLVNTHWHPEQTGANDMLGARGVPIIAHENTRRWMMTTIEQGWEGQVFEPRDPVALPSQTFYHEHTLEHGSEAVRLIYTPRAHTDGDIIAWFPEANVIAAGGTAYARRYPVLDTSTNGWIGELLDATRTMLSIADENTLIVPSDGGVLRRSDLEDQEAMLATLMDRFRSMSREGKGAEDMLQEGIADEFIEDRGDPTEFILTAWDGLWDHMRGLGAF